MERSCSPVEGVLVNAKIILIIPFLRINILYIVLSPRLKFNSLFVNFLYTHKIILILKGFERKVLESVAIWV